MLVEVVDDLLRRADREHDGQRDDRLLARQLDADAQRAAVADVVGPVLGDLGYAV